MYRAKGFIRGRAPRHCGQPPESGPGAPEPVLNARKGRQVRRPFLFDSKPVVCYLNDLNVFGLPALGALGHVELDPLAFLQ